MKRAKSQDQISTFEAFKHWVAQWADHDFEKDPRTLTCAPLVRRKTIPQVATIHGLIRRLADHTGDDFEDLKRQIKEQFGPVEDGIVTKHEIIKLEGEETIVRPVHVQRPKSIADYSTEEASALIDKILYLGANFFGVYLEIE